MEPTSSFQEELTSPLAGSEPKPEESGHVLLPLRGMTGPQSSPGHGLAPSIIQVSVPCHFLPKPFLTPHPKTVPHCLSAPAVDGMSRLLASPS